MDLASTVVIYDLPLKFPQPELSTGRPVARSSVGMLKNETTEAQLLDLGIYVQDYELHTAKQLGDIIPILKSMPRIASYLYRGDSDSEAMPVLAAS